MGCHGCTIKEYQLQIKELKRELDQLLQKRANPNLAYDKSDTREISQLKTQIHYREEKIHELLGSIEKES